MKIVALLICLLSVAAAQQCFSLVGQDGRAIALGNGGIHGYLKLAPFNPRDVSQQWYLEVAASGSFVVSCAYSYLNFDISGSAVAGTRLAAWERKPTSNGNQRFQFNPANGLLSCVLNNNTFVGTSTGEVKLEAFSSSVALQYIAAPTDTPTPLPTESPTQAPTQAATESPTEPPVEPTQAPTQVPTQAPTQAPAQAPTQAPALTGSTCTNNLVNPYDGKTWRLQSLTSLSTISLFDLLGVNFYQVNFCGLTNCGLNRAIACSSSKNLGRPDNVQFSFSPNQLVITAVGGTADVICPTRRSSIFTLRCKDVSVATTVITSGGCSNNFVLDVPLQFCS